MLSALLSSSKILFQTSSTYFSFLTLHWWILISLRSISYLLFIICVCPPHSIGPTPLLSALMQSQTFLFPCTNWPACFLPCQDVFPFLWPRFHKILDKGFDFIIFSLSLCHPRLHAPIILVLQIPLLNLTFPAGLTIIITTNTIPRP